MSRILIVEDDAVLRKHLARLFVREGYEVHTAEDCAMARRQLLGNQFDTLLLDVALPDGSGLDLLAEVGERQRPQQTLVMSAFAAPENEALAQQLNVCCLLRKPLDLLRLVDLVRGTWPSPPGRFAE
jgi:two-component system response regulator PilR (NtrC family)